MSMLNSHLQGCWHVLRLNADLLLAVAMVMASLALAFGVMAWFGQAVLPHRL